MSEAKQIRLSQAMIVRDEEENIERALLWGRSFVWEQIVVDTGSQDRTAELARALGAQVYHYDWTGDFSEAKNFALSKCRGDWIAFLDADEFVVPEDAAKAPAILSQAEALGANVIVSAMIELDDRQAVFGGGSVRRFFKNHLGIHYQGRIHEQLACAETLVECDATRWLAIAHTGYSQRANAKKQDRNLRLLQDILRTDPGNYEMLAYLGDEYRAAGRYREAEEAYRLALQNLPTDISPSNQRISSIYFYLLGCLLQEGGAAEEVSALYAEAGEYFPEDADFPYLLGWHFYCQGEYAEACPYLEEAIWKIEQFGTFRKALYLAGRLQEVYQALGHAYLQCGNRAEAVRVLTALLKADKSCYPALLLLLRAFCGGIPPEERPPMSALRSFFEKIYDFQLPQDRALFRKACEEAGCEGWDF